MRRIVVFFLTLACRALDLRVVSNRPVVKPMDADQLAIRFEDWN